MCSLPDVTAKQGPRDDCVCVMCVLLSLCYVGFCLCLLCVFDHDLFCFVLVYVSVMYWFVCVVCLMLVCV